MIDVEKRVGQIDPSPPVRDRVKEKIVQINFWFNGLKNVLGSKRFWLKKVLDPKGKVRSKKMLGLMKFWTLSQFFFSDGSPYLQLISLWVVNRGMGSC